MRQIRKWLVFGLLLAAQGLNAPSVGAQNAVAQSVPPPNVSLAAPPAKVAQPASLKNASQPAALPTATHRKSHKAQKAPPKELVLPPLPAGPLSQLPMEQIPATPAKVSYQGGLLTISAQNSTLGEILRDVRKLTGATIEIPSGSGASERVVAHLGPGAPRDVLAVLLNGTSFNYMMLGSSSDPSAVSSVILTPKPSAGDTHTAANAQGMAPTLNPSRFSAQSFVRPAEVANVQPGQPVQPAAEVDDSANEEPDTTEDNAEEQAQPQPGQVPPADANANANAAATEPQPADPNQPNAGPRTPEQILEMLRSRQQPPGMGGVMPPPQPPQPPEQ